MTINQCFFDTVSRFLKSDEWHAPSMTNIMIMFVIQKNDDIIRY